MWPAVLVLDRAGHGELVAFKSRDLMLTPRWVPTFLTLQLLPPSPV